jgi:hypothetical protein
MLTRRLTRTFRRASWRDPAARLVDTTAGSSCGEIPTAIASENSSASSTGWCSVRLMTKIVPVSTPTTWTSSIENLRSQAWNSVSGCRCPKPTTIRPNSASRARHPQPPRRLVFPLAWRSAAQPGQDIIGSQRGGLRRRQR